MTGGTPISGNLQISSKSVHFLATLQIADFVLVPLSILRMQWKHNIHQKSPEAGGTSVPEEAAPTQLNGGVPCRHLDPHWPLYRWYSLRPPTAHQNGWYETVCPSLAVGPHQALPNPREASQECDRCARRTTGQVIRTSRRDLTPMMVKQGNHPTIALMMHHRGIYHNLSRWYKTRW